MVCKKRSPPPPQGTTIPCNESNVKKMAPSGDYRKAPRSSIDRKKWRGMTCRCVGPEIRPLEASRRVAQPIRSRSRRTGNAERRLWSRGLSGKEEKGRKKRGGRGGRREGESPPRMSFVAAPSSDACVHPLHGDESSPEAPCSGPSRAWNARRVFGIFSFLRCSFSLLSLSLSFSFFWFSSGDDLNGKEGYEFLCDLCIKWNIDIRNEWSKWYLRNEIMN